MTGFIWASDVLEFLNEERAGKCSVTIRNDGSGYFLIKDSSVVEKPGVEAFLARRIRSSQWEYLADGSLRITFQEGWWQ